MKGELSTIDNPGNSRLMTWIRDHRDFPHDYCCLIWPFARMSSGYAAFGRQGKQTYVHRFMCELRHGPAPSPTHQAAHSCDRGHEGCVNPLHLDWKTPLENQMDQKNRGAGRPLRKLTIEQAAEIRALKGLEHTSETAKRFGIGETNVRRIQNGETWRRDRSDARRIFSDDEIRAIRSSNKTNSELAADYGSNWNTIWRIRKRIYFKHVLDLEAAE